MTISYTVDQFANAAYTDALGIARRGRDLCAAAFEVASQEEYLTSLFKAFRVPYKQAKDAGIKADVDAWAKAWHGTTASLIAPMKARGFKVTSWPNLRSGDGVVTIRTVADAAEDAKAKALADAERDAKDKLAFDQQQAELLRDKARSMALPDLVAVILASIQATSHTVADVVSELTKVTVTKPQTPAQTAKAEAVLLQATK